MIKINEAFIKMLIENYERNIDEDTYYYTDDALATAKGLLYTFKNFDEYNHIHCILRREKYKTPRRCCDNLIFQYNGQEVAINLPKNAIKRMNLFLQQLKQKKMTNVPVVNKTFLRLLVKYLKHDPTMLNKSGNARVVIEDAHKTILKKFMSLVKYSDRRCKVEDFAGDEMRTCCKFYEFLFKGVVVRVKLSNEHAYHLDALLTAHKDKLFDDRYVSCKHKSLVC